MSVSMDHLNMFVDFAAKELGIEKLPKIHFVGDSENKNQAFGHTNTKDVYVRITERHPIDIMRTIAHELMHCKQKEGNIQYKEDEANKMAGRIMRKFDTTHPDVFKDKAIKANMMEDDGGGMTTSALPANRMGFSSSTPGTGGIDTYDPLLKKKSKPIKRKLIPGGWDQQFKMNSSKYNHVLPENRPKKLRDIISRDRWNERRSDTRQS